jgi:murein DD-endopeptidase MepM/ murein hydrolase activator NlpD
MRRVPAALLLVLALAATTAPAAAGQDRAAVRDGAGAARASAAMEGTGEGVVDGLPSGRSGAGTAEAGDVNDPLYNHEITFPVEGDRFYVDSFGACRDGCSRTHQGIDVMADKMQRILAAQSGVVTAIQHEADGNYVFVTGDDGWQYWYIHVNNDTPGTDDGANLWEYAFAPGVEEGARVERGQFIAYVGDSGNAEYTASHLHFELHYPDGTWGGHVVNPYYSLMLAEGRPVAGLCGFNHTRVPPPAASPTSAGGYWMLDNQGGVLSYGGAGWQGGLDGATTVSGIASTLDGRGYWVVDRGGAVTPLGTARSFGDARSVRHAAIVNITRSRTGNGYYLLASDGRVFRYGDAPPVGWPEGARTTFVGMNRTATGDGYWVLDSRGRVFAYGNARDFGDLPAGSGTAVGLAGTATNNGYWVLTSDGRVHTFGDAVDLGDPVDLGVCVDSAAVRIRRTASGRGYWVAMSDGDIHQFGDAFDFGDPNDPAWWHFPIVDMALQPYR